MYRGRLRRDLDGWVARGMLQQDVADALLADVDSRRSAFSLGGVLSILAALLISAALLMLVAAGWEAIPRLVKVIGAFGLIWGLHLAAAVAAGRGAERLTAALLLLGAATFGGAIALIGQLYHISGDLLSALLLWFALTALSAFLFRSSAVAAACGALSLALLASFVDESDAPDYLFLTLTIVVCAAVVIGLAIWTRRERVAHFAYALVIAYIGWVYALNASLMACMAMLFAGLAIFAATMLPGSPVARRLGPAAPALGVAGLVLALMGVGCLHLLLEGAVGLALAAVATITVSIVALALGGRDNGLVRLLAYIAFTSEVFYLSFVTIDTMLGTSGFFLLSGFVVAIIAFLVLRLERAFSARRARSAP